MLIDKRTFITFLILLNNFLGFFWFSHSIQAHTGHHHGSQPSPKIQPLPTQSTPKINKSPTVIPLVSRSPADVKNSPLVGLSEMLFLLLIINPFFLFFLKSKLNHDQ